MRSDNTMRSGVGSGSVLLLAASIISSAFGWRFQSQIISAARRSVEARPNYSSSNHFIPGRRPLTSYEIALSELQQLESEPVCHRTAARLLINNCQLLDGKDEATVLTDSGRQIRDFVDAYAASLAICDLERGSFTIPPECYNFREPVLEQLSASDAAFLHVSSQDIDRCLSGLGSSDSGWNTWISYRHKALRFCEAARADNEKADHIRLFQRLTKVMSRMTDGVEDQFEKRMADLDAQAQAAGQRLDRFAPQLDHISMSLNDLGDLISGNLARSLQRSADAVNAGVDSATNIQEALDTLMQTILAGIDNTASAQERSIELVIRKAETETEAVMTAITAAAASVASLQNQLDLAHRQGAELEYRQAHLEEGMVRLINVAEVLGEKYNAHTQLLHETQNMTNGILISLEETAGAASAINNAFTRQSFATSWWPYIWCPAVSLVLGSYGLPPSAIRNAALVALGEFSAFVVSSSSKPLLFRFWSSMDLGLSSTLSHIASAATTTAISAKGNSTG